MQKSTTGNKVVTFGEVLMRLSPSGNRKFQQANKLDFFFGGTEMNVGASLANFGLKVQHVTIVSNDFVGEAALSTLRRYAIDVSHIKKTHHPLGIYFMEVGSSIRGSQVIYNRLHSCFANINADEVDWDTILKDCNCFHWSGISAGISEGTYQTLKKGLQQARAMGITITADPAYRSNLWKYGRNSREVLSELTHLSTTFLGGTREINEILGSDFQDNEEDFISACKSLIKTHPSIEKIFEKVRTSESASRQKMYGRAWTGKEYLSTTELEVTDVVDRIGPGDAFAAGIIYGLQHYDDQTTLEFANVACALKHTHVGDVNLVSVDEVMEVLAGNSGGRVKR
jgi:2-dehydro-3-deoxygluconokinase